MVPFLKKEGLIAEPIGADVRTRIEAVIQALGDRLKVFSDILKLGRYFFTQNVDYEPDAVKKRLRKEGVPVILGSFALVSERSSRSMWRPWRRPFTTTPSDRPQDGRRGQPAAGGVTGQGVGPGLYDCLAILGRTTASSRIRQTLAELRRAEMGSPE